MKQRQLTGNWYLKRTIWGTYRVMVEKCSNDVPGGVTFYKKANERDEVELGIYCNLYKA